MVFLVRGVDAENIRKKKKTDRRKTFKNEQKEKRRIQGKSNDNNKHFWFYLARKHSLKNPSSYHHILFKVLHVAGYLKRSKDISKLIWICISVWTPRSSIRNIKK